MSAIVAIAIYFTTALWLKHTYVERAKPTGAVVIELKRPFFELQGSDVAFSAKMPSLNDQSDTMEFPKRSPYELYENTTRLGPPHTDHTEIVKYGRGRFSHWSDSGFIFSTTDGTNPTSNGRTYWAVIPSRSDWP